jgi:hypothetical protein
MSTESETWVVDRFEAGLAVLVSDTGQITQAERTTLPHGAKEGTVLQVPRGEDGTIRWSEAWVDDETTKERLAEAERVLEELRKRDPGGDVAL